MPRFLPALTLFWRFFLVLLLATLVPLWVTWGIARGLTKDNAERLAEAQLRSEALQIAARAEGWLQLNVESLSEHADTIAMRSMLPELQRPVLIAIANHQQPWTQLVFTVGLDGVSLSRSDSLAPINYSERVYFKTTVAGQPLGQQMLISKTTNRPSWVVAVPIKDEQGKVVGVLAKTNGLNELTDQLANVKIGDSGRAILIAPDGKLAGMTGAVFDKELRDWSKHPLYLAREKVRGGILKYDDDGRPTIAVLQPVRFGWLVAVQEDESEALRPVAETDRTMLFVLAGAALLAALFAAIIAPGLSRPLVRLTTIAEDMSRGHFDHEIPGTERRDEIGALSKAIERMTRSLRLAMERIGKEGAE